MIEAKPEEEQIKFALSFEGEYKNFDTEEELINQITKLHHDGMLLAGMTAKINGNFEFSKSLSRIAEKNPVT